MSVTAEVFDIHLDTPELVKNVMNTVRQSIIDRYGYVDGSCSEASLEIAEKLPNSRVVYGYFLILDAKGNLVDIEYHWWVRWNDYIIDVTADQFNPNLAEAKANYRFQQYV